MLLVAALHAATVLVLHAHRLPLLATHYSLPDADYEGTLWNFWYHAFCATHGINPLLNRYVAFPVGFDYTYLPSQNLFTDLIALLLRAVGNEWHSLLLLTNVAGLLSYVLSGVASFALVRHLTRSVPAALVASYVFTYSFDHVMMSRGVMVFGQIWLIPLFALAYFRAFDRRSAWTAFIPSALVIAVLVGIDAYYALYSLLASLVMSLALLARFRDAALHFIRYFAGLAVAIVLCNGYMLYANLSLALQPQVSRAAARETYGAAHLVHFANYLMPSPDSVLGLALAELGFRDWSGGSLVSYTAIAIAAVGLARGWRKLSRFQALVLIGCLANIVLFVVVSTDIPAGSMVKEVYGQLFGTFRSVGRMTIFVTLFVSILVGFGLSALLAARAEREARTKWMFPAMLAALVVIEGVNFHPTWWQVTPLRPFMLLHTTPELLHAQAIAAFPRLYPGFLMGSYSQLAQVAHHRPIYVNTDPRSSFAREYNDAPDIGTAEGVTRLRDMGFDTILIFTRMYDYVFPANTTRQFLDASPLVTRGPEINLVPDKARYASGFEMSQRVAIYKIRGARMLPAWSVEIDGVPVASRKIDAYRYVAPASGRVTSVLLNEPFNEGWIVCDHEPSLWEVASKGCASIDGRFVAHQARRAALFSNEWQFTRTLATSELFFVFRDGVIKRTLDTLRAGMMALLLLGALVTMRSAGAGQRVIAGTG